MTTLIAVYNSEGCAGRCDSRYYDAQGSDCDCICGGKNHGAGLQVATEYTRNLAREQLQEIRDAGGFIAPEIAQMDLL